MIWIDGLRRIWNFAKKNFFLIFFLQIMYLVFKFSMKYLEKEIKLCSRFIFGCLLKVFKMSKKIQVIFIIRLDKNF